MPTEIELVRTNSRDSLIMTRALYDAIYNAHQPIASTFFNYARPMKKGNYLDIASDGKISWRPLDRIIYPENDGFGRVDAVKQFQVHGRMRGKPAKTLKAFLQAYADFHTAVDWELFSNRFLAASNTETKVELVSGEDIRTLYHESSTTRIKAVPQLRNSCMRYSRCQPFLDLYVKNPNKVEMLVEFDSENMVTARALVWHLDRGDTFMDRIYGDNNSLALLRQYAKDMGWWYRARNSYDYTNRVVVDDEEKTRVMRVSLEHKPVDSFPWLDTLLYYSKEEGVLGNTHASMKGRGNLVELRSADGGYITPNLRW